jgi:hypothetical protein
MYGCLGQCCRQGLEKDDAGPHSGSWHGLLGWGRSGGMILHIRHERGSGDRVRQARAQAGPRRVLLHPEDRGRQADPQAGPDQQEAGARSRMNVPGLWPCRFSWCVHHGLWPGSESLYCFEEHKSHMRPVCVRTHRQAGCEAGLGRQESAEAIVLVREHEEGPDVEEDGNLGGSWDRRTRQNAPDGATTGWAKAVKAPGFDQRAESCPALLEGTSKDVGAGTAVQPIPWRTGGCSKARPVV